MNIAEYIVAKQIPSVLYKIESCESGGFFAICITNRLTGNKKAFLFPADIKLKDFLQVVEGFRKVVISSEC